MYTKRAIGVFFHVFDLHLKLVRISPVVIAFAGCYILGVDFGQDIFILDIYALLIFVLLLHYGFKHIGIFFHILSYYIGSTVC